MKNFKFQISNFKFVAATLTLALAGGVNSRALAISATTTPAELASRVGFDQRLGANVPRELPFLDEDGRAVRLGDILDGRRPAVLVLGYHECPMLCSAVLSGLTETLTEMRASAGRDFDLIDISINPTEPTSLAAAKRRIYLKRYRRPEAEAGWHFLTGSEDSIRQAADAVGFRYAYDAETRQYAHASGLVVLTPEGRVSRYLFGATFDAQTLSDALKAAGARAPVGSPIEQLLMLCFHYNPLQGKYGALVLGAMRAGGAVTLVILIVGIGRLLWRERQRTITTATPTPTTATTTASSPT